MMKGVKFLLCGRDVDTEHSLVMEGHVSLSKARKAAKKKEHWTDKTIWELVWRERTKIKDKNNDKHEFYLGESF